jgi:TPR repeat protein
MINYANAVASGLGGRPDPKASMHWFQMAADAGNPDAMFNYALGLEKGHLGAPDPSTAAKYYKMAADLGHRNAITALSTASL